MIKHATQSGPLVWLSLSSDCGTWGGSPVTTSSLCVQFTKLYHSVTSLHLGAPSYRSGLRSQITGIIMDLVLEELSLSLSQSAKYFHWNVSNNFLSKPGWKINGICVWDGDYCLSEVMGVGLGGAKLEILFNFHQNWSPLPNTSHLIASELFTAVIKTDQQLAKRLQNITGNADFKYIPPSVGLTLRHKDNTGWWSEEIPIT